MSNLMDKINLDLKQAMRQKQLELTSVLRLLLAAIHNKEIALRRGEPVELSDEQIIEVINSEIKKRKEAAELYQQGSRIDLANKEKSELEILQKYLPAQLSDQELENIIKQVISSMPEAGLKDFGKVMGQVMARVKGKAEGVKVGEMVKKILNK